MYGYVDFSALNYYHLLTSKNVSSLNIYILHIIFTCRGLDYFSEGHVSVIDAFENLFCNSFWIEDGI